MQSEYIDYGRSENHPHGRLAQPGRATALHADGRGFKSLSVHTGEDSPESWVDQSQTVESRGHPDVIARAGQKRIILFTKSKETKEV